MNFYAIYSTGADRLKRKSLPGRHPAFIRINPALFKVILMRATLIILLLTIGLMQVHADSFGQQVSLNVKNAAIKSVIKQVQTQTGYSFLYTDEMLNNAQPVTVKLKNATIEETLQQIFHNQPLTFDIQDKTVILQRKQPSLLDKLKNELGLSQIDVIGIVVDEQDQPVSGANITVKGTGKSTITDAKGYFQLINVPDNATVVISYIGFVKRELPVAANMGKIKLTIASNQLDAVQVTAYGQTTERLSTGDISTVMSKTIGQQPVDNSLLALEGQVPGLFITQSTGIPGSGVTVQIRGTNSIANGKDPFYVIDGVPYTSELLPNSAQVLGTSASSSINGNPLSFLNPDDIESISVLKDASATSIYGSRAANGAIIITTKKGKAGDTKVDVNLQQGFGSVSHFLDLLNTQQYIQMREEAITNDGLTIQPTDYDINGLWDKSSYTNWQKTLIGGTAKYLNYTGTISGGSENTQYLISSTFHRETNVFPGSDADDKGSVHVNINSSSANKKFRVQFQGNYMDDNNNLPSSDLTYTSITLPPDAPALYNKGGSLNWEPNSFGSSTWANPLAYLLDTYDNKTKNVIGNLVVSYQIITGLTVRSSIGYNDLFVNEIGTSPLSAIAPENRATSLSSSLYGYNDVNSWIAEPQAEYTRNFGKGKLDVLAGMTFNEINSNGQEYYGYGYNSDLLLNDPSAAANIYAGASTVSQYKYNALFGKVSYNYDDTYLLDLSARRFWTCK